MYEFTKDCLIHIEEIDKEHEKLFSLINEAFSLVRESEDYVLTVKGLLKELKEYAATHFAHEEAYMESIHDPELALQRIEHAAFTSKINDFELDTSSPEASGASFQELMTYLVRWLYHHILSSDMMIGKMKPHSPEDGDIIPFTGKYQTGISLIDDEHKKLFEIINDTYRVIHAELLHDKYDEIVRLLSELRDYTQLHFHDEEAYMERISYPGLNAQKAAHAAFVDKLVKIDLSDLESIDNNQQEYLSELIQFLLSWLSDHILMSDKKIGAFVQNSMKK